MKNSWLLSFLFYLWLIHLNNFFWIALLLFFIFDFYPNIRSLCKLFKKLFSLLLVFIYLVDLLSFLSWNNNLWKSQLIFLNLRFLFHDQNSIFEGVHHFRKLLNLLLFFFFYLLQNKVFIIQRFYSWLPLLLDFFNFFLKF